jgi:hypothetical protein
VCVSVCLCHGVCVEVRGQLVRLSSFLLLFRSWGLISGCQIWWQVSLYFEQSCWPIIYFFERQTDRHELCRSSSTIPALWRQRQEDKASLIYILSSKTARSTERPCLKTKIPTPNPKYATYHFLLELFSS